MGRSDGGNARAARYRAGAGIPVPRRHRRFGAGSKFAWEAYGGYSYDFNIAGRTITGTLGYRALAVDYVQQNSNGHPSGINAILHGPVFGFGSRF